MKRKRNRYEADVLHPYVAQMLRIQKLEYDHEVNLTIGRPDFVAMEVDNPNSVRIIEVKRKLGHGDAVKPPLMQICSYIYIYEVTTERDATGVLAVPAEFITQDARVVCEVLGIELLELYPDITILEYNQMMNEMNWTEQEQWAYSRKKSIHPKYTELDLPAFMMGVVDDRKKYKVS